MSSFGGRVFLPEHNSSTVFTHSSYSPYVQTPSVVGRSAALTNMNNFRLRGAEVGSEGRSAWVVFPACARYGLHYSTSYLIMCILMQSWTPRVSRLIVQHTQSCFKLIKQPVQQVDYSSVTQHTYFKMTKYKKNTPCLFCKLKKKSFSLSN